MRIVVQEERQERPQKSVLIITATGISDDVELGRFAEPTEGGGVD